MCQVSVILPLYNAEKTLARCLDSLLRQTFSDFEVLLINDGSTDKSLEICQAYCEKDKRFRLYSQRNQGPSSARNAGMDRAAGVYLYFVDADDYIEDQALAELYEAARSSGADMTICGFDYVKEGLASPHSFAYPPGLYEGQACRAIALDLLGNHSAQFIPPYSVIRMIRKDLLNRHGLRYDQGIIRSEDYLFTTELHFLIDKLCLITDQVLYHYIDCPGSITNRYVSGYWSMAKAIYTRLRDKLPNSDQVEKGLDAMLIYRSLIALNNASRAGDKESFNSETGAILRDPLLFGAIDRLSWSDGFRRFGAYYPLMRLRCRRFVRLRYYVKHKSKTGKMGG